MQPFQWQLVENRIKLRQTKAQARLHSFAEFKRPGVAFVPISVQSAKWDFVVLWQ